MEFTAAIVCGKGKALTPFSQARSTGIPKPLLPIANKPMVQYVLDWCLQANFSRIIVLFEKEDESSGVLEQTIKRYQEEKEDQHQ